MACSSDESDRQYESGSALRTHWTQEEDRLLRELVATQGAMKWAHIAKAINTELKSTPPRNGKSCRLRWYNQLCPDIRKGPFTPEERDYVIAMQQKLGNRWAEIAQGLPGRTDNAVKNFWNGHIRRLQDRPGSTCKSEPVSASKPEQLSQTRQPIRKEDSLDFTSIDSSTVARARKNGTQAAPYLPQYDARAETLRERCDGVRIKIEPHTPEQLLRERERVCEVPQLQDAQTSDIQKLQDAHAAAMVQEKRRDLMVGVARKVLEVVTQRDKEDQEIMDELDKFDSEMHKQLLHLVCTVSRSTVKPRSSYSNPSRTSSAGSDALNALFNAARRTSPAALGPPEPSMMGLEGALTGIGSRLDYSHIPALQSLLSGGDTDQQQVAENTLASPQAPPQKVFTDLTFDASSTDFQMAPQMAANTASAPSGDFFAELISAAMGKGRDSALQMAAPPAFFPQFQIPMK